MSSNDLLDFFYALAISVIAITIIYRICEGVIQAMEELDQEKEDDDEPEEIDLEL